MEFRKKILALFLAAATVVSSVSVVSVSAESEGGGTVVIGAQTDVVTLDPGRCYEPYANLILRACYDCLYEFQDGVDGAQPSLATGIEYSEDGLTATVTIREDVVFASGNPLTAKDVQFSIMRCKYLQDNPSFICDGIDSIDVIDDYTVQFNLNTPDSSFTSKLAYASMSIIDSELAMEQGATDAEDAATTDTAKDYFDAGASLGSGPYVLESWIPDEEFVLVKNENYYDEASSIDEFIIQEMDDANTQMMSLSQGDIQIALNLNADTVSELEGTDGVEVIASSTMTMGFLFMNMDEEIGGPVSDPLVQQAIRLAIDYEGIQQIVGEGSVTPLSYIQVGLLGAADPRDTDYRDVEQAKELMAEAGYEDGFEIDFPCCTLSPEGIALTDLAVKLASDLSEIGITLNIQTEDWNGGYADEYRNGELGFSIMYWSPDYIDPNAELEFLPGGIVGLRAGWTEDMDPDLAAMKSEIVSELDEDARVELLAEMQEATAEYGPFIPLVQYPKYIGADENLVNITFSDSYRIDLRAVDWA
ncbi:MAG: ABC transporter substrate-binding protein [Clostridiales bacterium]|nr:ABC transporter substrate-binding protein [Clostridiales bacterium]